MSEGINVASECGASYTDADLARAEESQNAYYRQIALQHAVRPGSSSYQTADIIAQAQAFYDFLKGAPAATPE